MLMSVEAAHMHTGPHTCLGNHGRYRDFIAKTLVNVKCYWQGLGAQVGSSLVALGRFFWVAGESLVVRCVAHPPLPSLLSVHELQGHQPEHTGLLLGFEPVVSWEPLTLRLGPFQLSLFRKKFHPGSSSVAAEDQENPGETWLQDSSQSSVGKFEERPFLSVLFQVTFFQPFLNEIFYLLQTLWPNPLVYFCDSSAMKGIRSVSGPIKYFKDRTNEQYEGKFQSRCLFLIVAPVRATTCFPWLAFLVLLSFLFLKPAFQ